MNKVCIKGILGTCYLFLSQERHDSTYVFLTIYATTYLVNCTARLPALPLMLSGPPRTDLSILRHVNLHLNSLESGDRSLCEATALEFTCRV
jgi:hypothetical protein